MTTKLSPETAMERNVTRWANARAAEYDNHDLQAVFKDLFYGGCQSGMVGHLIYYKDTLSFYRSHKSEINELLVTALDGVGESPSELFGDKWDKSDPLANDTSNQNLLAWFGFEEAARRLCDRAGIEA